MKAVKQWLIPSENNHFNPICDCGVLTASQTTCIDEKNKSIKQDKSPKRNKTRINEKLKRTKKRQIDHSRTVSGTEENAKNVQTIL